jgi:cytochrome c553
VNTHIIERPGAIIFLISMLLFAHSAAAAGDVEQGKELGFTCLGCHGIDGYRNAYPSFRVPKLAGQQGAYIASALRAYRDGTRSHPTMKAQASSLTDQDIENLIAWIASSGDATDTATAESAARVAPAATCIACHGADGEGVIPQPPILAGQEVDYLEYALHQYKEGTRGGTVMSAFAASLSDADIAQLAKFYSSQDGLKTLQP